MKLSVYYVVKNEIRNLPKSLENTIQFADEIVIVDTGSTDGTLEWLQVFKKDKRFIIQKKHFKIILAIDLSSTRCRPIS